MGCRTRKKSRPRQAFAARERCLAHPTSKPGWDCAFCSVEVQAPTACCSQITCATRFDCHTSHLDGAQSQLDTWRIRACQGLDHPHAMSRTELVFAEPRNSSHASRPRNDSWNTKRSKLLATPAESIGYSAHRQEREPEASRGADVASVLSKWHAETCWMEAPAQTRRVAKSSCLWSCCSARGMSLLQARLGIVQQDRLHS